MNILDENGESYLVTPFNHAAQQQRAATGKHAFAGADIDTAFTEEVVELGQKVRSHDADQLLYLTGQNRRLIPDDFIDLALFQDASVLGVTLAGNAVVGFWYASSDYIGENTCRTCWLEECCTTNCLSCQRRHYPDCEWVILKQFYLEEEQHGD